jgi:hypothetical protein
LGNTSGTNNANYNLSNGSVSSGIVNPSGSTTYVYGNPLYVGVNSTSGGFGSINNGMTVTSSGVSIKGFPLRCETGLGDGLNAITAGTYLQSFCYNDSAGSWTITGIKCYVDGGSSSTLNAAGNTLGALLTGPITCSTSFAAGNQSANVALTSGDYIKFTFVADGTAKQTTWVVSMVQ